MKIFLVGNKSLNKKMIAHHAPYLLISFLDFKTYEDELIRQILSSTKMFLLDSGAFTFIQGQKRDWNIFLDDYIAFIKKWNIKYFFELDLDTVIGVEATKKMTEKLEREVGRQSIPVFHACRGLDRWRDMCKNYDYVAIGASGITPETQWTKNPKALQQLVRIAHSYGAQVHGLGYTKLNNLNNTIIPFDSVDSTAVVSGERYAKVYKFSNGKLLMRSLRGRSPGYKILDDLNIEAWIEMANYKDQ